MTDKNSLHKAVNSLNDNSLVPANAKSSSLGLISIKECRKLLDDWTSSDAEITKLKDTLEILINNILNEALNGKRKGSNIL